MPYRIIDFSDEPASLSVRYNQLLIKKSTGDHSIPLEEIEALIVAHPAVHYTHAVLTGVCANNGVVIFCDDKKLPAGMLLPLASNTLQTERISAQINLSLPTKKQLWQKIIKAKIKAQANLLILITGDDYGLENISRKVRSGDPANMEGNASRRYWHALFGGEFRRIPGSDDGINRLLNYGYAVLRGIISRQICAAGLHPSIGLHHHNRYNPFCLADDLMEPYRPVIDKIIYNIVDKLGQDTPLNKTAKTILFTEFTEARIKIKRQQRTISDSAMITAQSLMQVCLKNRKNLILPE